MTHRERILAILHGRTPDRVPWFGDLDYLATSLIHKGQKTSDFKLTEAYIQWHRELGVGFYLQGSFPFKMIFENCRIKEYRDGDLRIEKSILLKGCCGKNGCG